MITGTSLHYITGFIASALKIDNRAEERQARTLVEQRVKRQEQKREIQARSPALPSVGTSQRKIESPPKDDYSEWLKQKGQRRRKSGIPSTILEEDDSSDGF